MSIVNYFRVGLMGLAALSVTACNAAELGTPEQQIVVAVDDEAFRSKAEQFMEALFAADESRLLSYEAFPGALSDGGKGLADRNQKFIAGPLRAVLGGGRLVPILDGRNGHRFTVLFVQEAFVDKARDKTFLSTRYLENYFACAFEDSKGRWLLRDGFCYSETDGPYPNDDPDL